MAKSTSSLRLAALVLVGATIVSPEFGLAADPQPYAVDLPSTGEPGLDAALRASSVLISLREKAPVGPFALITRAREDRGRLAAALDSFGYYGSKISVDIAADRSTTRPCRPPSILLPPRFRLPSISTRGRCSAWRRSG